MNRSVAQSLRLPVALAAAATLAACGGTVDFDVSRSFDVNATATSWSGEKAVDLAADAPKAWKQRSHIDSIQVVSADAEITVEGATNAATTGSGTASFRPEGGPADGSQDVLVGTWTNIPIAVGSSIAITPSAQLDEFLNNVLKGSGKFTVVASGTTDTQPAVFTVKVSVGAKLKWKPF
jgi:hypothetical protein